LGVKKSLLGGFWEKNGTMKGCFLVFLVPPPPVIIIPAVLHID